MAFGRDVRKRLFGHVQTFSAQEVATFGAPTLITRTTNDVQQVQMVVLLTFTMMIMAPILLVGGVIMAHARGRRAVRGAAGLGARARASSSA